MKNPYSSIKRHKTTEGSVENGSWALPMGWQIVRLRCCQKKLWVPSVYDCYSFLVGPVGSYGSSIMESLKWVLFLPCFIKKDHILIPCFLSLSLCKIYGLPCERSVLFLQGIRPHFNVTQF